MPTNTAQLDRQVLRRSWLVGAAMFGFAALVLAGVIEPTADAIAWVMLVGCLIWGALATGHMVVALRRRPLATADGLS